MDVRMCACVCVWADVCLGVAGGLLCADDASARLELILQLFSLLLPTLSTSLPERRRLLRARHRVVLLVRLHLERLDPPLRVLERLLYLERVAALRCRLVLRREQLRLLVHEPRLQLGVALRFALLVTGKLRLELEHRRAHRGVLGAQGGAAVTRARHAAQLDALTVRNHQITDQRLDAQLQRVVVPLQVLRARPLLGLTPHRRLELGALLRELLVHCVQLRAQPAQRRMRLVRHRHRRRRGRGGRGGLRLRRSMERQPPSQVDPARGD